ncbi:MAG TPA: hypothetical protein VF057_08110, partial [Thermoanaerobaculia bacterium]
MTKRILLLLSLALAPLVASAQSYSALLAGDGAGVAVISIDGTTIRYSILAQGVGVPTQARITSGGTAVVDLDVSRLANGRVDNVATNVIDAIRNNPAAHSVEVAGAAGIVRGSLIQPVTSGARTQFVPVVGKVAGAAGTNFVTDIRIINYGSSNATVTLDYFQQSATGHAAPTATSTTTVAPGEQKVLDDIIGVVNSSGLGGLRVTSTENVEVRARVLNDLRSSAQGTTGFAVEAGELADAATSGTLAFLSAATTADIGAGVGFRTNIGYFNPTGTAVTATFTARRTDGSIVGAKTTTIPGYSFVQQPAFALIDTAGAADQVQPNFYVTWTSNAPLFVYAAVVD